MYVSASGVVKVGDGHGEGCRGDALVCEKVRHYWGARLRVGEGCVVLLVRVLGLGLKRCESCAGKCTLDTVLWLLYQTYGAFPAVSATRQCLSLNC